MSIQNIKNVKKLTLSIMNHPSTDSTGKEVIQKFINKKMTDSSKISPDATPNDVPRPGLKIAHAYNDPNDLSP